MNPPSPPGYPRPKSFPWFGCSLGCAAITILGAVGILFAFLAALELPPFSHDASQVPSEFVGDWRADGAVEGMIVIQSDGRASCSIKGSSSSIELSGARARFDSNTKVLSIKFWFIGAQWHVDERPTQKGQQMEMILNGQRYLRSTPANPPGESPSTVKPWEV